VKMLDIQSTNLDACVTNAQSERIVITRDGNPVALVVGVQGLDEEQIQLGSSDEFWEMIAQRRKEKTINRAALAERIDNRSSPPDPDVQ
jgi:antitoxin (DNA-binding transcriptional repressor) of toxin-antitoxin stability system